MKEPKGPVFLHSRPYRQRRLVDGIRLLPVLGFALFFLPLLWPVAGEFVRGSRAIVYVFGAWMLLIALSAGLALVLRGAREGEDGEGRP